METDREKRKFIANLPMAEIKRLIPLVQCYDRYTLGLYFECERLLDNSLIWCGISTFGRIFAHDWVYFALHPESDTNETLKQLTMLSLDKLPTDRKHAIYTFYRLVPSKCKLNRDAAKEWARVAELYEKTK